MNYGIEQKNRVQYVKPTFWGKISAKLQTDIQRGSVQLTDATLLNNIKDVKTEWESAYNNYEHTVDQEMIDYYLYKIKACEIKYQYLLKEAKDKGVSVI